MNREEIRIRLILEMISKSPDKVTEDLVVKFSRRAEQIAGWIEKTKPKTQVKKEIVVAQIPSKDEFLRVAGGLCQQGKLDFNSLTFEIEAKYDSWVEAGWKDGNNKKILNWKTKLKAVLPHFKGIRHKEPEINQVVRQDIKRF